jgi:urease accessory protein
MPWHARLRLHYSRCDTPSTAPRTRAQFRHEGPLRILQSLYPEGPAICHNVMVHPPSGLVGGDVLDIEVQVEAGAHGLLTTPGASRYYRSEGLWARQHTRLQLAEQARMEWLPLESICYQGCLAENRVQLALAPGAELIGWDLSALGLPGAGKPFLQGHLLQHLELPGVWLERGLIDAQDHLLMDGELGLAGQRCIASVFFLSGSALDTARRARLLESAQQRAAEHALAASAGASSPNPQVIVLRVLAPMVEPALALLRQVWAEWRQQAWGLNPNAPRIWST